MSEDNCPFCATEDQVIKENGYAKVLLSNPRKVAGHVLVMPKRHVEKPWELTPSELQDIFELIFFVEQRLVGNLGEGVDIRQNYRPFMNQSRLKVDHVLFHVIPRSPEDYIYETAEKFEKDLFADLDKLEHDEVAKLLQ